ncbi:GNAT family N-acetyltransferase [Nocardia suismassiliense]|uniref:GNAT family N-acetyltransferase n=1 Tax=Nocardia suismassiliense TaxID=2077092 RepID=A0ABW6R0G0_9NOCA
MLHPDYPIVTERLLLRPATLADLDEMYAYKSQPDVCRYLPYEPMSREQVAERISGLWARTELTEVGQALNLCVEEKASGRLLGDVVLFWRNAENRTGEIGYVFSPDAAGHGYATEAATELLRLGFEGLVLHRITAQLDARNTPSARVLERLGMRREAVHREDMWFKNEWSDSAIYAMLAHEWHNLKTTADDRAPQRDQADAQLGELQGR